MRISAVRSINYGVSNNNRNKNVSFGNEPIYPYIVKRFPDGSALLSNGVLNPPPPPPSDQSYTEECNGGPDD